MKQVIAMLASVCICMQIHAQFSVKGTVTNSDKESLIGAQVVLLATYYQTVTDQYGTFEFKGIKNGSQTIRVSYVGYEPMENTIEVSENILLELVLKESPVVSDAVIVTGVRASHNTPTTFSMIGKEEISRKNLAQDIPYLFSNEPSVVATSDAGTGVGYTGLRIRGSDMTRINVTINGIPLNDPESHAVYWVDIPDFASSVNSIQLQRGVGSSTNGAGAFGASMNLETNVIQSKPFAILGTSYGSFHTNKNTFQAGTGLIRDHWYFEGRASAIGSDGYVDRASSSLGSYFMQGVYRNDKTLIKAITFGGSEKTYQAWYGVDAETMKTDRTFNWAGAVFNPDGSMWFYNNQTDNYRQNHYQLHISHQITPHLSANIAGHYTYGRGYYEEYQQDAAFAEYGLPDIDTIRITDLVRRRWLDNHYYGLTWTIRSTHEKTDLIIGGAWNKYDKARHFGEITWAELARETKPGQKYYENSGHKSDFNAFLKAAFMPAHSLTFYADIQYRYISMANKGLESHLEYINILEDFHFLNPKAGISWETKAGIVYVSYSIAHREPIRDDYVDASPGETPQPETLGNLEIGIRKSDSRFQYGFNYYLMNYLNQLVLTGEINDDGAYIRKNSGKSYRTGIEFAGGFRLNTHLGIRGNVALSSNKADYSTLDEEGNLITYQNSDISFSPQITGGLQVSVFPMKNVETDLNFAYVGKQFLDNTGNEALSLDNYLVSNLVFSYLLSTPKMPGIEFSLLINNLFNTLYESNGYVYGTTPYYFPQAGINYLAGVRLRF